MAKVNFSGVAGNKAKYERVSFNLLPGASTEKNITGEFIYCVDSNIGFELALDDDRPIESDIGIEYRQEPGEAFTRITVVNTSATTTLRCSFLYGYGKIEDRRLVPVAGRRVGVLVQNFPTEAVASATSSLPATTGTITFDGIPTGDQIERKALIVTNEAVAGGNSLQVETKNGNTGLVVFPQSSIVIETNDEITINNISGGAINCRFMEIWYTNA